MAKDLILDVVARKNSRDLVTLADEFDRLAREAEASGKSMDKTRNFAGLLDQQIARTKDQVRQLAQEFDATGNKDVFGALSGARRNLKSLEKIKTDLSTAIETGAKDGVDSGIAIFSKLPTRFGEALGNLPPVVQAGIAAAVAVVAPTIGAALGGAVLAGLGAAGIGAGIAAQIHDPHVEVAIGDLGDTAKRVLTEASAEFVPHIAAGIRILEDGLTAVEPVLEKGFDRLAPTVDRLASGLSGLIQHAGPGLEKGLEGAAIVLNQIADDLPGLGDTIGQFFQILGREGPAGASALHEVLTAVEALTIGAAYGIEVLSKLYQGLKLATDIGSGRFDHLVTDLVGTGTAADKTDTSVDGLSKTFSGLGEQTDAAGNNLDALQTELTKTTVTADQLAGQMSDKIFNAFMSVDQAVLSVAESHTRLSDALDKNGRALDINKEKGQANREAILAAVSANIQQYDATIAAGGGAATAAIAYDQNTQALQRQLEKAGFTSQQIDGLIGKYRSVPDTVNTEIATKGLTESVNDLSDLLRYLNGLQGQHYHFTVDATYAQNTASVYSSQVPKFVPSGAGGGGSGRARASGGPVTAGQAYVVGEQGMEWFVPSTNGYVVPNNVASSRSGGSFSGSGTRVTFAGALDTAFATLFMQLVRTGLIQIQT